MAAPKNWTVTYNGNGLAVSAGYPSVALVSPGLGASAMKLQGVPVSSTAPTSGQALVFTGSQYVPSAVGALAPGTFAAGAWGFAAGTTLSINGQLGSVWHDAGTVSGAVALNAANGNVQQLTLGGNVTSLSWSNLQAAFPYQLVFKQDATGGRTVSFTGTLYEFGAGGAVQPSSGANQVSLYSMLWDGQRMWIVRSVAQ